MKIFNISSINQPRNNYQNRKIQTQKNQQISLNLTPPSLLNAAYYLPFKGGDSLDLAITYKNFQDSEYPNIDIKKDIETVLEEGNEDKKTLYDIHFNKYRGVLDCFSLEELKEKYPEFKNVISVWDIDAQENSFIGKYQYDKSDIFSNDEDLTLQLIKLYWGQGFSLNDLSKYIAQNSPDGKKLNLYYALTEKMKIPTMNSHYANVLRLSNKDYNTDFCEQMSIKRKEAAEAKQQKAEGEAVIIPRGELSEAHKKHISESLKEYYKNHPEALIKMSERQKKFYEENPKYQEELSEIMLYAWNKTQEGRSIKKHLSKFLRKYYKKVEIERLTSTLDLNKEEKSALEAFWSRNTWAKEKMSIAREKAKIYFEEKPEIETAPGKVLPDSGKIYELDMVPDLVRKDFYQWAKDQGYGDVSDLKIGKALFSVQKLDENEYKLEFSQKLIQEYENSKSELFLGEIASAIQMTIMAIKIELDKNSSYLPPSLQANPEKAEILSNTLQIMLVKNPIYISSADGKNMLPLPNVERNWLNCIYTNFMNQACTLESTDMIEYANKKFNNIYENIVRNRKNFRA